MAIFFNSRYRDSNMNIFKEADEDEAQQNSTAEDTTNAENQNDNADQQKENNTTTENKENQDDADNQDDKEENNDNKENEKDEGDLDFTNDDSFDDNFEDDNAGENDNDSGASSSNNEDDSSEVDDIKKKEEEILNLSVDELEIKHRELKNGFLAMFDMTNNFIDRLSGISTSDDNTKVIEFVSNKLISIRDMITDYMNYTYKTKSYIENSINYNRFLVQLSSINKILRQLSKKDK